MPRLTLIYPSIGHDSKKGYVRSWQMQPLAMAVLAGLTPKEWEISFFDDRIEEVDDSIPADLVAISVETFTARRGYQLASRFRNRGVPVIMGGYHATFRPEEVLKYSDSVCIGEAEPVWKKILEDVESKKLQKTYRGAQGFQLSGIRPDRSIFKGKKYFNLALVESGRGCRGSCEFCSISAFYGSCHRRRPVSEVIDELRGLAGKPVFFVDDNLVGDGHMAREFFRELKPLGIRWVSQASLQHLENEDLVSDMAASGCAGLLVGFESLENSNLQSMGKSCNHVEDYGRTIGLLRRHGISLYGTFMVGYPYDSQELIDETVRFAETHKFYLAAFNHVVPFPGTDLYRRLSSENRFSEKEWWLGKYRFGQVPFNPEKFSGEKIEKFCHQARKSFYSTFSILKRAKDLRANCRSFRKACAFFTINFLLQKEVSQKQGYPLGNPAEDEPRPIM
ncbi:MAG: radical SAM protein [Victivallales bacterium]